MFRNVTVSGVQGSVQWGYRQLATLGKWTVTRIDAQTWSLTATVISADTLRLSRRPLVFVAPHAEGAWRFPFVSEPQIKGVSLTATLGPKDK